MNEVILKIENVSKHFGPTVALKDINLSIKRGTIHSLVGRNGAGKSTLVNIIAGIHPQDSGSIYFEDKELGAASIFERQKLGIRLVTQHASVVPYMTVAENIFIGLWPTKNGYSIDWNQIYVQAEKELIEYGLDVDPYELVKNLSPVEQRKLNIIRSLYGGGKVIILDEPTTSLSAEDRDSLFGFIKILTQKGTTFILISHYLEEILLLSDEISVLRDGIAFIGYIKEELNEEILASLIAGENVAMAVRQKPVMTTMANSVLFECKNLCADRIEDVSLTIHKGEILGLVGFPGSGAREFCRAIYGLSKIKSGSIVVNDRIVNIKEPGNALDCGIVYIPNDRHKEGIVQILSIRENIALPNLKRKLKRKFGFLNSAVEQSLANSGLTQLNVKANSVEDKLSSLSGGNQQKVVVSRALTCDPQVLILDEPTIGIDIKSREEILELVNAMTQTGMSAIYLTNDFGELIRVSDRLVFFEKGRINDIRMNIGLSIEDVIRIRDAKKDGNYEN